MLIEAPPAPEWDRLLARADEMALVLDQHLDDIAEGRDPDSTVGDLRPDQQAGLVSDLAHVLR